MVINSQKQVMIRDLIDEAKKRIVFLAICVVGLSYLMSLTSTSVLVNLPASALLIIILRYLSLDYERKRKSAAYKSKTHSSEVQSFKKQVEFPKGIDKSDWRRKVNSPVVEVAIDQFTRHLVSEWVTDLWYSRLTPDKDGPEELVYIVNGVLGEFSAHLRNVNIINLLTRDLIGIVCTHLELFRATKSKMEKQHSSSLSMEQQDKELRLVMAAENKLHPALFSVEAEHKVLQHIMDGLIPLTFKSEDLQCSFFHYIARELLSCAVMRPVLNLANPRFINERIESVVLNNTKANRGTITVQAPHLKPDVIMPDHFTRDLDPSVNGVELIQLKNDQLSNIVKTSVEESKDPLLSVDTRATRSWSSLPTGSCTNTEQVLRKHRSGADWGDMLDIFSVRKTQALAPDHIQNMWTKGLNYKNKEGENHMTEQASHYPPSIKYLSADHTEAASKIISKDTVPNLNLPKGNNLSGKSLCHTEQDGLTCSSLASFEDEEGNDKCIDTGESYSSATYTSEEDESSNITGLDSPVTKVWNGKNIRNLAVSHIHHPLENFDGHRSIKGGKGRPPYQRHLAYRRPPRTHGRKRTRSSNKSANVWQEVERTSFLSGDGQDILNSSKDHIISEDSSDDYYNENLGRIHSGTTASSSAFSLLSVDFHSSSVNSLQCSLAIDSFFNLRCEVIGANIVKSDSKTFAVYSISVTDANNHTWSIKRRFRHFDELHRRLKEYPEYDLQLPPKPFLSTGLDVPVIRERCKLLGQYLKRLMQLPTVSGSIELWDFLSVDSQTYIFSDSFSIIQTLSVDLEDKPSERTIKAANVIGRASGRGDLAVASEVASCNGNNSVADGSKLDAKGVHSSPQKKYGKSFDISGRGLDNKPWRDRNFVKSSRETVTINDSLVKDSDLLDDASSDPTLPSDWVPQNLIAPILDLVDVVFQLQDGGWIRRNAFWVAKQILQLGMGDALDDWLIKKIQLLRRGSVVASGITILEQILWPDGIFITKHPKRSPPQRSTSQSSPQNPQPPQFSSQKIEDVQAKEAARRAKFVYELMIENAPPAIVSLIGRKEYEQCAKDLYFFLQSSVCLKQLSFDLLELLLLSAFPELDAVFKQLHDEKHKFGELETNS